MALNFELGHKVGFLLVWIVVRSQLEHKLPQIVIFVEHQQGRVHHVGPNLSEQACLYLFLYLFLLYFFFSLKIVGDDLELVLDLAPKRLLDYDVQTFRRDSLQHFPMSVHVIIY
jgi:hypothetical protein